MIAYISLSRYNRPKTNIDEISKANGVSKIADLRIPKLSNEITTSAGNFPSMTFDKRLTKDLLKITTSKIKLTAIKVCKSSREKYRPKVDTRVINLLNLKYVGCKRYNISNNYQSL